MTSEGDSSVLASRSFVSMKPYEYGTTASAGSSAQSLKALLSSSGSEKVIQAAGDKLPVDLELTAASAAAMTAEASAGYPIQANPLGNVKTTILNRLDGGDSSSAASYYALDISPVLSGVLNNGKPQLSEYLTTTASGRGPPAAAISDYLSPSSSRQFRSYPRPLRFRRFPFRIYFYSNILDILPYIHNRGQGVSFPVRKTCPFLTGISKDLSWRHLKCRARSLRTEPVPLSNMRLPKVLSNFVA